MGHSGVPNEIERRFGRDYITRLRAHARGKHDGRYDPNCRACQRFVAPPKPLVGANEDEHTPRGQSEAS